MQVAGHLRSGVGGPNRGQALGFRGLTPTRPAARQARLAHWGGTLSLPGAWLSRESVALAARRSGVRSPSPPPTRAAGSLWCRVSLADRGADLRRRRTRGESLPSGGLGSDRVDGCSRTGPRVARAPTPATNRPGRPNRPRSPSGLLPPFSFSVSFPKAVLRSPSRRQFRSPSRSPSPVSFPKAVRAIADSQCSLTSPNAKLRALSGSANEGDGAWGGRKRSCRGVGRTQTKFTRHGVRAGEGNDV